MQGTCVCHFVKAQPGFVHFSVAGYTLVNFFLINIGQWTVTFSLEGDAHKGKGNESREITSDEGFSTSAVELH